MSKIAWFFFPFCTNFFWLQNIKCKMRKLGSTDVIQKLWAIWSFTCRSSEYFPKILLDLSEADVPYRGGDQNDGLNNFKKFKVRWDQEIRVKALACKIVNSRRKEGVWWYCYYSILRTHLTKQRSVQTLTRHYPTKLAELLVLLAGASMHTHMLMIGSTRNLKYHAPKMFPFSAKPSWIICFL